MKKIKAILQYDTKDSDYGHLVLFPIYFVGDRNDVNELCDAVNERYYGKTGNTNRFYCVEDFIVNDLNFFSYKIEIPNDIDSVDENISEVFGILITADDKFYGRSTKLCGFVNSKDLAENALTFIKDKIFGNNKEYSHYECFYMKCDINNYWFIYSHFPFATHYNYN